MPPSIQAPCCCFRWGIVPRDRCPDTAIINVYEVDDCIPPHIDHHDFDRPFCTISLLSEESILFSNRITPVSPGVFDCDYSIKLPVGEWGYTCPCRRLLESASISLTKGCLPTVWVVDAVWQCWTRWLWAAFWSGLVLRM